MEEKLYSVAEAAQKMSAGKSTVNKWIADGLLPALRVGKSYVVTESAINAFVRPPMGQPRKRPLVPAEK